MVSASLLLSLAHWTPLTRGSLLFLRDLLLSYLRAFGLAILSAWKILDIHVAHFLHTFRFLLNVSNSESPCLGNLFQIDIPTPTHIHIQQLILQPLPCFGFLYKRCHHLPLCVLSPSLIKMARFCLLLLDPVPRTLSSVEIPISQFISPPCRTQEK